MQTAETILRREMRPGDAEAIVDLHERIYPAEYGVDHRFVDGVRSGVATAVDRGWPDGGGAWFAERGNDLLGCLALTAEEDGIGRLRWVLLDPSLRGQGVGARMISEAVELARGLGFRRLELSTFKALSVAGGIYRSHGFEVVSEETTDMWGPEIVYQHYALDL